jgi:hypothetical protein
VIYAERSIGPCEELSYDSLLPWEPREKAIPCKCGAPQCRGWLNWQGPDDADGRERRNVRAAHGPPDLALRGGAEGLSHKEALPLMRDLLMVLPGHAGVRVLLRELFGTVVIEEGEEEDMGDELELAERRRGRSPGPGEDEERSERSGRRRRPPSRGGESDEEAPAPPDRVLRFPAGYGEDRPRMLTRGRAKAEEPGLGRGWPPGAARLRLPRTWKSRSGRAGVGGDPLSPASDPEAAAAIGRGRSPPNTEEAK